MITTRNIEADDSKKEKKLKQVITKDIDASPPKAENPSREKTRGVSTHTIADVADIQEKARRDKIMAEKGMAVAYDGMADMETKGLKEARELDVENDKGFNLRYAIVEIDELLQGFPRRELK